MTTLICTATGTFGAVNPHLPPSRFSSRKTRMSS